MSDHARIDYDYDQAFGHVANFRDRYVNNMVATVGMLNGARDEYNQFLQLPETPSALASVLDIGWTLAASFVPVIKFGRVVEEAEKAVRIANRWNQSAPLRATLTLKIRDAIQLGDKAADIYNKGASTAASLAKSVKSIGAENEPLPELADADMTSQAVREVVVAANAMQTVVEATRYFLATEKYRRKTGQSATSGKSMLTHVHEIHPLPPLLSTRQLDQIKRVLLWGMFKKYCSDRKNVILLYDHNGTSVVGLNDRQKQTILKLFGFGAPRGGYFDMRFPPASDVVQQLLHLGATLEAQGISPDDMRRHTRRVPGSV